MYRIIIGFVATFILIPLSTQAAVIIVEVAWMGTETEANNEWIEIYNGSNVSTDITGWTLTDGNSLDIALSGTMSPNGVFLLERTDDTTVPDVLAAIIYTGALVNGGATLTIKDSSGATVSELVGGENWENIGGDNELKYTAQLTTRGTWVTGIPTPGMPNIEEDAEIPENITDSSSEKNEESGGGVNVSISLTQSDTELQLSLLAPRRVYVNQSVNFSVEAFGIGKTLMESLVFDWNFGDLSTGKGKKVEHMFKYPGEYVVVARAMYARHDSSVRQTVEVLPVSFSVSRTLSGDVEIYNESPYEVDLGGFVIRGDSEVLIPENTILLPSAVLTLPRSKLESGTEKMIGLYDQEDVLVAMYVPEIQKIQVVEESPTPVVAYKKKNPAQKIVSVATELTPESEVVVDIIETNTISTITPDTVVENTMVASVGSSGFVPGNMMPYFGLLGIIALGGVALYTNRSI